VRLLVFLILVSIGFNVKAAASVEQPVVLELFTSQSCSSCPTADKVLKELSESDHSLLALSFHVDYWDYLGWKDTYSSEIYTDRQRLYARKMESSQVFTPQLIINGTNSAVGSDNDLIRKYISIAKHTPFSIAVELMPMGNQHLLTVKLTAKDISSLPNKIDIWQVSFDHFARTQVNAGENVGRTLESVNNVTSIKKLVQWQPSVTTKILSLAEFSGDGVAVIAQEQNQGKILGAGWVFSKVTY